MPVSLRKISIWSFIQDFHFKRFYCRLESHFIHFSQWDICWMYTGENAKQRKMYFVLHCLYPFFHSFCKVRSVGTIAWLNSCTGRIRFLWNGSDSERRGSCGGILKSWYWRTVPVWSSIRSFRIIQTIWESLSW